jgi:hypothetical protein
MSKFIESYCQAVMPFARGRKTPIARDLLVAPVEKKFRAAVTEQILNHMKDMYSQEFAAYEKSDQALTAYMAASDEDKSLLQKHFCGERYKKSDLIRSPKAVIDDTVLQSRKPHLKNFWAPSGAKPEDKKRPLSLIKYLCDHYLLGMFNAGKLEKANNTLVKEIDWTIGEILHHVPALKHDELPDAVIKSLFRDAFLEVPAIMKKSLPQTYGESRVDVASLTKTGRAY